MKMAHWQKRGTFVLLTLAFLSFTQVAYAAKVQSARMTVDQVTQLFSSKSSVATVNMRIVNEDGQRDMSMKIWSLGEKVLIRIISPPDEAGVAILKTGSDIRYY